MEVLGGHIVCNERGHIISTGSGPISWLVQFWPKMILSCTVCAHDRDNRDNLCIHQHWWLKCMRGPKERIWEISSNPWRHCALALSSKATQVSTLCWMSSNASFSTGFPTIFMSFRDSFAKAFKPPLMESSKLANHASDCTQPLRSGPW